VVVVVQGSVAAATAADYQLAGNRTRLQLERSGGNVCPPGDAACFCRWKGALGMFADAASSCQVRFDPEVRHYTADPEVVCFYILFVR